MGVLHVGNLTQRLFAVTGSPDTCIRVRVFARGYDYWIEYRL